MQCSELTSSTCQSGPFNPYFHQLFLLQSLTSVRQLARSISFIQTKRKSSKIPEDGCVWLDYPLHDPLIVQKFKFIFNHLKTHISSSSTFLPSCSSPTPPTCRYFYAVTVTSVSFQNSSLGSSDIFPLPAIIDTGSTLTLLHAPLYDALVEQILVALGGPSVFSPQDSIECIYLSSIPSNLSILPDIVLETKDGDPWKIPYLNYFRLVSIDSEFAVCFTFSRQNVTILGDSWLQNFDVVYDDDNKLIHWLPVNCTTGELLDSNDTRVTFPSPVVAAGYKNASSPRSPPYPPTKTDFPPSTSSPSTAFTSTPPPPSTRNGSLSTSPSLSFPPPNSSTIILAPRPSSSVSLQHHSFAFTLCAVLLPLILSLTSQARIFTSPKSFKAHEI